MTGGIVSGTHYNILLPNSYTVTAENHIPLFVAM
jgi:hypothetical protein